MAGRKCSICNHPKRNEIDKSLSLDNASLRTIAVQYRVSKDSLKRHMDNGHIVQKIAKAAEAKIVTEADTLLDQVKSLSNRALSILSQAEGAGDLRTACSAIREVRSTLELLLKVSGELKGDQPVVNIGIMIDPEKIIGTESYREYEQRVYAELAR
jgi:hypothetical protein